MTEGDTHGTDRRTFLKATGAAGAAVSLAPVASAHEDHGGGGGSGDGGGGSEGGGAGTRRVVVGVSDAATTSEVAADLPREASVVDRDEDLGYLLVELPDGRGAFGTLDVQSEIATDPRVKYTEREATYYPTETPDDDLFSEQYAPQQVRAPAAWERTEGSSDVTVAIVDQGVKYDHPDLQAQFGETKGKDFVDDDGDPMPGDLSNEYHGTHVAGIASATTNNGTGVAGVSDSTLLSCRALGTSGGSVTAIADAIKWATDQGADVINMSLGGGGRTETMKNAVSYAVNNGALPIAAAGNACADQVEFPARYDECVAVSAIDENRNLASFSNHGPNVDVTGPGVDVVSCWTEVPEEDPYGGKYNAISGTSMSTPAVSGVAALGKAVDPDLSPTELRGKLKDTAVDVGLADEEQGAGRADAVAMVDGVSGSGSGPTARLTATPSDPHVGEKVSLSAGTSSDDGYVTSWEWDFGDGTTGEGERQFHAYDSPGQRTITLTVTDDSGATDTATATVDVQAGSCAAEPTTEEFSGNVGSGEQRATHTYAFESTEPCKLVATIEEDVSNSGSFTLYFSQRSTDFLRTECEGQIVLRPRDIRKLDPSADLTVGIYSGSGRGGRESPRGDYTVTLEEYGFTAGGGDPNEAPTAAFSPSAPTLAPGESVTFDASGSSDPDGSIDAYEWEFGDGSTASGETAVHSYGAGGTYRVTLTVTDDAGATDTATTTVTVEEDNTAPAASFTASPSSASVGETVEFDAGAADDADGTIDAYEWALGDGATATGETVTHSYDAPGDYSVTLTVTDDDGATDSATETVTVESAGGGGGECGDVTETRTETGTLEDGGSDAYTYATRTAGPCEVNFTLSGDAGTDFDLYVTFDGRTPTSFDYDRRSWNYGSDESISVEGDVVDGDAEFGVLVESYSGAGDYELTIEELGTGSGGDDPTPEPDPNEPPSAGFTVSDDAVQVGTEVTFDAAPSEDPDGSIAAHEWSFGDGTDATGQQVRHAFDSAGDYGVTLTVTDDDGATASASRTVTVTDPDDGGDGGGTCGDVTETATVEGTLDSSFADESYAYDLQTGNPCQVTVSLSGDPGTDFDLYVTTDGRTPTTFDYDARSITPDSQEQVVVEAVEAGTSLGILVDAWEGSGNFTLSIEELGK